MKQFLTYLKYKFIVVFFLLITFSAVQPYYRDTQIVSVCDTNFVLKKYSVVPPVGFLNYWMVDPEINILGNSNDENISIRWSQPGEYTIIAQFSNGYCISESLLYVVVEDCPEHTIYIPNTFTPNQDYNNETFGAYGTNIDEFNMEIYNRWGELLFVSNTLEDRWNGYFKGKLVNEDVYIYKIQYKSKNFISKFIYGKVLLMY